MDQPQVRPEAGQPVQPAGSSTSSSSAPASPAPRPPRRWASSATTSRSSRYHDSPRRAHSIAAQGGINAAKNYRNDGDSVHRLFYDTVKGGDYRSREANVHRLAEVSVNIIDQCDRAGRAVRPRVRRPARQPLLRRRPGRRARSTPGARPASSCCSAPTRRSPARSTLGTVTLLQPHGHARRRRARRPRPRHRRAATCSPARSTSHSAARGAPVPPAATATSSSCRPTPRPATSPRPGVRTSKGAAFANPCYTQIHPTCIPPADDFQSKLTLMSESLRNDGRIWVPKELDESPRRRPTSPRTSATTTSSASTRRFGNLVPARRRLPQRQDRGRRGPRRRPAASNGVYLDFADAIGRLGQDDDQGALREPVRHVRAHHRRGPVHASRCASTRPTHYTMGGLWVDYNLQTTIPGLFVLGEANFSDHGANRLGASALMQGLADGYFVAPYDRRRLPGAAARHLADGRPTDAGVRRVRAPRPRTASTS
ncbi:MAG: FAD-binding protein [Microthrixaceae bacterium]